eukprot:258398-Chlamydomonas_euryale.AAC.1
MTVGPRATAAMSAASLAAGDTWARQDGADGRVSGGVWGTWPLVTQGVWGAWPLVTQGVGGEWPLVTQGVWGEWPLVTQGVEWVSPEPAGLTSWALASRPAGGQPWSSRPACG